MGGNLKPVEPKARVLVVDNRDKVRNSLDRGLTGEGYAVRTVGGNGTQLYRSALKAARQFRPHVAIVDLRLDDDSDTSDTSGIDLLKKLKSNCQGVQLIVYSAYLNPTIDRDINAVGATWIDKSDSPLLLKETISRSVRASSARAKQFYIRWPNNWDAEANLRKTLGQNATLAIVEDTLYQLFQRFDGIEIFLLNQNSLSPISTATTRHSFVVAVVPGDTKVRKIVKISNSRHIKHEITNYVSYVRDRLPGQFHTLLEDSRVFWDVAAAVYSFIGNSETSLPSMREHYFQHDDPNDILRPIRFFLLKVWNAQGSRSDRSATTLFDRYERNLNFGQNLVTLQPPESISENMIADLPDPVTWLVHRASNLSPIGTISTVIHGDFHTDNIFTDGQHLWVVDYENTGRGHVYTDIAALAVDVMTRLVPDRVSLLNYAAFLDLLFSRNGMPQSTQVVAADRELLKAASVIAGLRVLATEYAAPTRSDEFDWSLLCTAIAIAVRAKQMKQKVVHERAWLLVAYLCRWLERSNVSSDDDCAIPLNTPGSLQIYELLRRAGYSLIPQNADLVVAHYTGTYWAAKDMYVSMPLSDQVAEAQQLNSLVQAVASQTSSTRVLYALMIHNKPLPTRAFLSIARLRTSGTVIMPVPLPAIAEALRDVSGLDLLIQQDRLQKLLQEWRLEWHHVGNPYKDWEKRSLSSPEWYFGNGKKDEANDLLARIIREPGAYLLTGMRRVGKTAMANHIERECAARQIPVARHVCDELHPGMTLTAILHSLRYSSDRLSPDSSEWRDINVPESFLRNFKDYLYLVLHKGQKRGRTTRVVIILDEIDRLLPKPDSSVEVHTQYAFVGQSLKSLLEDPSLGPYVSIIVTADTAAVNRTNVLPSNPDFENPLFERFSFVHQVRFLSQHDCFDLIESFGAVLGLEYTPEALKIIYNETAGHPAICRDVCTRIVTGRIADKRSMLEPVTAVEVHIAMESYLGSPIELGHTYPQEILYGDRFRSIGSVEPEVLTVLALFGPMPLGEITTQVTRINHSITRIEINEAIRRLIERSIVVTTIDGVNTRFESSDSQSHLYAISVPILREWILMNHGERTRYAHYAQ